MPITEDRPAVLVFRETSRWSHPTVVSGGWDFASMSDADACAARFAAAAEGFRRAGRSIDQLRSGSLHIRN